MICIRIDAMPTRAVCLGCAAIPEVLGGELFAQQDRSVADSLLDDPGALDHGGDELEHAAPAQLSLLVVPCQEPVCSHTVTQS